MNFARWRKCDFQIHTPRDPNWSGPRPPGIGDTVSSTGAAATAEDVDSARAGWATAFVDACLDRRLEAIAITDHHEMVMIPYVQREIAKRRESEPGFDFWLFPGMELTAAGGSQCLILFDADLSPEWWKQAQGKLGIVHAGVDDKAAQSDKVTQLTSNYAAIGRLLDEISSLKGRYIVLPNVSQGGNYTVLTEGGHGDFRRMPYVGGYLDTGQTIDTLGSKNRKRLSGTDSTWSTREIYPLPTSDSRSADFASLGKNNTWIKLAVPTAEAIRQAFLGHPSRISIKPPALAPVAIAQVEIDGSSILGKTDIALSSELNAVIGGRGSGKSSFLEYVAFGLGRSCYDIQRDHYSGSDRMRDLIKDTLVSKGGRVALTIIQDNAPFRIERAQTTAYQPQITYPNGDKQAASAKDLRALFPAVVYAQGELAEIGKQAGKRAQLSDLLQFVNPDFKREDDKSISDIELAKADVRAGVRALVAHWADEAQHRKLTTTRDSLKQRVEALEKTLPKLADSDKASVDHYEKMNEFEAKRLQASKHAAQIQQDLDSLATELLSERDLTTDLKGGVAFGQSYRDLYRAFSTGIAALQQEIKARMAGITQAESAWTEELSNARKDRDAVLEKLGAQRAVTTQIIKNREEVAEVVNEIGDLETKLKASGNPNASLATARENLKKLNDARATRTQQWAKEIERLSSGKITARVNVAGDLSEIRDAVDIVAAKTGSQEATRLKALDEAIQKNSIDDVLDGVLADCRALLRWRQTGTSDEEQPNCPDLLRILGGAERVRSALAERIDSARVEAIAAAVPKPEITLMYCDGSREISFEKASEGQRAAALLFMLLEQAGGPLIIDQPEGDLDNKIISDLTDKLHSAKQNRQLLFASHNANIVVNGSSELVGYLDVKDDGERQFDCDGAIDKPDICKVITSTMEGGEKAFRDRQNKYGY